MPPPQRSRGWDYGRSRPPWSRSPESGARRREVQSPLKMGPSPLCRRKRQHFGTSPRTRRECGRSVQPEFAAKRFDLGRTREQENPRSKISRRKRPSVPRAIPPSGMRSTILTIFGKREECLEDATYGRMKAQRVDRMCKPRPVFVQLSSSGTAAGNRRTFTPGKPAPAKIQIYRCGAGWATTRRITILYGEASASGTGRTLDGAVTSL